MEKFYHFVAISGSLREGSYNSMLLTAAQKLPPINVVIEHLYIDKVPLYNFGLHEQHIPVEVEKLADIIKVADAIIFVTAQYNDPVSGVLENFIDFVSLSPKKPFDKKPVGIISAGMAFRGVEGAQHHLPQMMLAVNACTMNLHEGMIVQGDAKFDEAGNLTDEKTKTFISKFVESLAAFSDGLKQGQLNVETKYAHDYSAG